MDIERRTELVRAARALFRGKRAEAGTTREIGKLLGARERELPELQEILGELEEAGLAVHVQGRGWLSPRAQGWIVGTLTVNRRGFGFVRPANEDEQEGGDLFVPERKIKDAHHGDLVLVKVRSKGRDAARGRGKPRVADAEAREGRVLTVLRRSPRIILGRFWEEPAGGGVVEPLRHESVREIFVPPERIGGAEDGDRVLARLLDAPTWGGLPQGEVVEVALPEGSWEADLQLICAEHGIRREFPEEALEAAAALPGEIPQEELARRTDLRDVDFFTTTTPSPCRTRVRRASSSGWRSPMSVTSFHPTAPWIARPTSGRPRSTSPDSPSRCCRSGSPPISAPCARPWTGSPRWSGSTSIRRGAFVPVGWRRR
jgi:exoribonuclease R